MLTSRQKQMLDYIKWYSAEHGFCPTFAEMMVALRITSKSQVYYLLEGLEERGHIRRIPNRSRAIEIITNPHLPLPLHEVDDKALLNECWRRGYHVTVLRRMKPEPRLVARGGTNE
jgi:repressor LexA